MRGAMWRWLAGVAVVTMSLLLAAGAGLAQDEGALPEAEEPEPAGCPEGTPLADLLATPDGGIGAPPEAGLDGTPEIEADGTPETGLGGTPGASPQASPGIEDCPTPGATPAT